MSVLPGFETAENPSARTQEADTWIAQRLREIDYDLAHPVAQLLADHLQSVGVGTLTNLRRSNELLSSCERLVKRRLPVPPQSWQPQSWPHESQSLIVISVRAAVPGFITRSMPKWDPRASAITTYFVNYCLFKFIQLYLEYCKEERREHVECPVDEVLDTAGTRAPENSSEDLAIARQTIREATALVGSQEFATIVLLIAKGLTRRQIAAELDISVTSLDRRLAEYRRKLQIGGW